jgi:sensor domain CHASE-containing protein
LLPRILASYAQDARKIASYLSCKAPIASAAAVAAVVVVTVSVVVSHFNQTYKCGHTSAKLMASFTEIRSRVEELLHTNLQTSWQTHGEAQRLVLTRSYCEHKLLMEHLRELQKNPQLCALVSLKYPFRKQKITKIRSRLG